MIIFNHSMLLHLKDIYFYLFQLNICSGSKKSDLKDKY